MNSIIFIFSQNILIDAYDIPLFHECKSM